MSFFQYLQRTTEAERAGLFTAPVIARALAGTIVRDEYVAFLIQAYHHVRHTAPLLKAVRECLSNDRPWLRAAVEEYITEETGHEEWILDDIAACGVDREAARNSTPNVATELMVAYAWDMVQRVNPLGFFGMVHVLEGTSVTTATRAADAIQQALGLPDRAFTYLRSHGALDQQHVAFFAGLMDRITDPAEQDIILHCARVFYQLYGDIFRSLAPEQGAALAA
jgi:pyrroloquinoline quinone (PQQ) biosynthesis protein C